VSERPRFHLAFPVCDLAATERFYVEVLGAQVGRRGERWIDFDLRGHQLSSHLADPSDGSLGHAAASGATNLVDGDAVPVRHFGLILPWAEWRALADAVASSGRAFRIAPRVRFEGEVGEQGTFFIDDPSGNVLEFKAFRRDADVFAA